MSYIVFCALLMSAMLTKESAHTQTRIANTNTSTHTHTQTQTRIANTHTYWRSMEMSCGVICALLMSAMPTKEIVLIHKHA